MAKNDAEAIVDLYKTAAIKTMITGVKHQVDHTIPLNHPLVCGLHVSWNMDILTADENLRKSNSIDLDSMSWTSPNYRQSSNIEDLLDSVVHKLGRDSVGSHDQRDGLLDSLYRID